MQILTSAILVIFAFISVSGQVKIYDTIVHASLNRTYLLHIPPAYNAATSVPLVIGLHGGGSPGWQTFDHVSQLSDKSNSAGFMLVYPEGIKVAGVRAWNGGGCCSFAVSAKVDDVGFINALIDTLSAKYNIDTTRIYATGLSNGAIMTYRLASELSHRIAAIATVAGTMEDSAYIVNLIRPVPVIHFHSIQDSNIFLDGGFGTSGLLTYKFNPVNYGLQKIAVLNKCNSVADSTYNFSGGSFYYKKVWKACDCSAEQILYVTGDGGHSWPGGNTGLGEEADLPSSIVKANDSIWSFFQKHTLICNSASNLSYKKLNSHISVYPNPFTNQTTIKTNKILKNASLKIYNSFGQLIKQENNISTQTIILNRNDLVSGLYLLQLTENNTVIAVNKFEIRD